MYFQQLLPGVSLLVLLAALQSPYVLRAADGLSLQAESSQPKRKQRTKTRYKIVKRENKERKLLMKFDARLAIYRQIAEENHVLTDTLKQRAIDGLVSTRNKRASDGRVWIQRKMPSEVAAATKEKKIMGFVGIKSITYDLLFAIAPKDVKDLETKKAEKDEIMGELKKDLKGHPEKLEEGELTDDKRHEYNDKLEEIAEELEKKMTRLLKDKFKAYKTYHDLPNIPDGTSPKDMPDPKIKLSLTDVWKWMEQES